MNDLIQSALAINPSDLFFLFMIIWIIAFAASLTFALSPPSFFTFEELTEHPTINDAYVWLEFDDIPHEEYSGEYNDPTRLNINGRLSAIGSYQELQGVQVNPNCADQRKFLRACWKMYGTGRTEPDPIN